MQKRNIATLYELCYRFTDLNEQEIEIIADKSKKLKQISCEDNVDAFVSCKCRNANESIAVAEACCEGSGYYMSTLGFIIREIDEPALFRTFNYGLETKDVLGSIYGLPQRDKVIQHVVPIKYGDKTIGAVVMERPVRIDIKLAIEEEAKQWKDTGNEQYPYIENLDIISDCIDRAVIILNQEGYVVFRNANAATMYLNYGYIHDILRKKYNEISMHGELCVGPETGMDFAEIGFYCKGKWYKTKQYYNFRKEHFYLLIISDVTQQKLNDEKLAVQLLAIKEANHRIKNNLMTIYNMLEMQQRRMLHSESVEALQISMNRIMSVGVSYEAILNKDTDTVNLLEIIQKILKSFVALTADSPTEIHATVRGDAIEINVDMSTYIALTINELMQNSFKYAFVGREVGHIDILLIGRPLYSEITVTDDGVGFDQSAISDKKNSLGFKIVENIVKSKLKGRVDIQSSSNGTTIKFDFKTK